MEYLKPVTSFYLKLPKTACILAIKGYQIIEGKIPPTYGDILNEFSTNKITPETLSFNLVFEEIMEKNNFFMKEKGFLGKNFFFLNTDLNNDYRWTHILNFEKGKYATVAQNPNKNYFIESWINESDRNHLLKNSIFFVVHSRKELNI